MNSPHHPHHHDHHDVHQQRLLWFFSFCNQRSSSSSSDSGSCSSDSSSSSSGGSSSNRRNKSKTTTTTRRHQKQAAANRNKFAIQYQQQLQQQQKQSSNVFGCELIQHTNLFSQDDSIPHIVKSCTRFIEKHGIIFGIYRLSGMRVNIHKLRQEFDKNPKVSMIDSEAISNDAHAVACVLKQYFRELPTPLLTFHMYEKFIELFKHNNSNKNDNKNMKTSTTSTNISTNRLNPIKKIDKDKTKIIHQLEHYQQNYNPHKQQLQQQRVIHHSLLEHDNITNVSNSNCGISSSANFDNNKTTPTTMMSTVEPSPAKISATSSTAALTIKSKSTTQHVTPSAIETNSNNQIIGNKQQQFSTSASDSQLLSLSSVVTTTTTDVKYQVKLDDLRKLLLQLPKAHYQTLKYLMRHLACIAANGQKTGMDSKNVAIVWAPNLLKPRELELTAGLETLQIIGLQAVITEQLIKHHEFLFDDYEKKEEVEREDQEKEVKIKTSNDDNSKEKDLEEPKRECQDDKFIDDDDEDDDNKMKIDNDISKTNCDKISYNKLQLQEPKQPLPVHKNQEQVITITKSNELEDKQDEVQQKQNQQQEINNCKNEKNF